MPTSTPTSRTASSRVSSPGAAFPRSLLDAFHARFAADGMPGFFERDIRWDDAGHALASERIAEGLRALGVARGRGAPTDG
jgi:hypothetical protein